MLRDLTPEACEAVCNPATSSETTSLAPTANREASLPSIAKQEFPAENAAALLACVHDLDLFTVALDDGHYRYHHLFHDFLRARAGTGPR